jgi:lysozyme
VSSLKAQLVEFEGRRNVAYPDPLTGGAPWTIGIGHTGPEVHEGLVWTDAQIDAAFALDCAEAEADCQLHFPWYTQLNEPRQAVLIGMCFQMGINRVLKFVNTLAAMRDGRYADADDGMCLSQWAKQTPKRAKKLARQMSTGEWQ